MKIVFKTYYLIIITLISGILNASDFYETFNKKISLNTDELKPQEFFDILSKETGIDFVLNYEYDFKISVLDYNYLPIKNLLKNLENGFVFQFFLRFDKEKPYFAVKLKKEVEEKIKSIGEGKRADKIDISLKDAFLIDIFKTLSSFSGKNLIIKNEKIKERKYTISAENKDLEEIIEKISKEIGFSYKITEKEIIIW